MISAGLIEGPYMTYSEPWSRNPPKPQSEIFLRPAPKLLPPPVPRCITQEQTFFPYRNYNGVPPPTTTTYPNGTRIAPSRPISKYPSPPPSASSVPVNLTQPKEEIKDEPLSPYSPYRLFPHSAQYSPFPYSTICHQQQQPYTIRTLSYPLPSTPLSPQQEDHFSTNTTNCNTTTPSSSSSSSSSANNSNSSGSSNSSSSSSSSSSTTTFLLPSSSSFSPPSPIVVNKTINNNNNNNHKRNSPIIITQVPHHSPLPHHHPPPQSPNNFKVPSGKEGSMKHRILADGGAAARTILPLDLQKLPTSLSSSSSAAAAATEGRKRLSATISPPPSSSSSTSSSIRSPRNNNNNNNKQLNNNTVPGNFQKGQLIQLANGDYKRIEDMRTEDFVQSAEKSPALRLAESTVLKIVDEGKETGHVTITLTYDQRRAQVEVDSTSDHPYFVMGQGWASFNPDKTFHCYGLKVHRLQVGDILISLTPREAAPSSTIIIPSKSTTIMTTATTTAISARQYPPLSSTTTFISSGPASNNQFLPPSSTQQQQNHHHHHHFNNQHHHHHRPVSLSPPKIVRSPEIPHQHYYNSNNNNIQMVPLSLDTESRKRRWSAPDTVDEEELNSSRRNRLME